MPEDGYHSIRFPDDVYARIVALSEREDRSIANTAKRLMIHALGVVEQPSPTGKVVAVTPNVPLAAQIPWVDRASGPTARVTVPADDPKPPRAKRPAGEDPPPPPAIAPRRTR